MSKIFYEFLANESGATTFEYAVIISIIALSLISALNNYGNKLTSYFNKIADFLM